jgi:hypothetical protein
LPSAAGCHFTSRAVAGVFNDSAKLEVFRSPTCNTAALPRYIASVVVQWLVSYFLFIHLSRLLRIDVAIAKAAVETGAVLRQLHGVAGVRVSGEEGVVFSP